MGNRSVLTRMAVLVALLATTAGCATAPPLYSYTRANQESQLAPAKGDGFEFMVSPGWQPMEGISAMKKGEQFRIPLDWLEMDLGARVQDTSGYSQFGFEFGNLRAIYRKPGKGGVLVVFTSWGGTRESLPEGIKRYLDSVVPDNKPESTAPQRIKLPPVPRGQGRQARHLQRRPRMEVDLLAHVHLRGVLPLGRGSGGGDPGGEGEDPRRDPRHGRDHEISKDLPFR
jgi:hypothetical protein